MFQESLSAPQAHARCSTRRHTQRNNPTYQVRNASRWYKPRFPPVPRGCGGQGVPGRLCLYRAASFDTVAQRFKGNRERRGLFKGCEKILIPFHVAHQLVGKGRKLLALGLCHVIKAYDFEFRDNDFGFLGNRFPVLIKDRLLCVGGDFLHLFFDFYRGNNAYAFFIGFHMASDSRVFPEAGVSIKAQGI